MERNSKRITRTYTTAEKQQIEWTTKRKSNQESSITTTMLCSNFLISLPTLTTYLPSADVNDSANPYGLVGMLV